MNYIMFIQNGENIGYTGFDDYEKAHHAMKGMVAAQVGVTAEMLDGMMNESGDGPFFYVHLNHAYVEGQGETGSLAIRIEEVEEPLTAYAELSVQKTGVILTLIDQFCAALENCRMHQDELEMEPMSVLPLIGQMKGSYEALQAVDFKLDEETEKEYQKFCAALDFCMGFES